MRVVAVIAVLLAAWALGASSSDSGTKAAAPDKKPHVHKHQHRDGGSTMDEEKEEELRGY
jgi:hypothetical protein